MIAPPAARMAAGAGSGQGSREDDVAFEDLAPNLQRDSYEHWRRSLCGPYCTCHECTYKRALERAGEPIELTAVDRSSPAYRAAFRTAGTIADQEERARRMRVIDHIARELLSGRALG